MKEEDEKDRVFAEWKVATGSDREKLERELVRLLRKYAFAITYLKLKAFKPGLVNNAVEKALRCSVDFRGEAKFSTWFHTIVDNLCNSYLRKLRLLRREQPIDDVGEEEFSVEMDPTLKLHVQRVVGELSAEDREFVEMKAEGLSGEEIAARTGVSKVLVRKRWERLKEKLKSELN